MRAIVRAALGVALLAPTLVAQQLATASPGRSASCLDSIPPTAFRRTPVYIESDVSDAVGTTAALIGSADILSQTVAEEIRGLLAAKSGEVPAGDSVVAWTGLAPDVAVTAYRDGHFAWRTVWPPVRADEARNDDGARLVSRALETVKGHGEIFLWDQDAGSDSLTWMLRLARGETSPTGQVTPPMVRVAFLAFTVRYPTMEPVRPLRARAPHYPPLLKMQGFTGSAVIEFVVDTSGHPEPQTVHDRWPKTRERLTGDRARAYATFVEASRAAVLESLYVPARLGGCAVRQIVSQPFGFELKRY
jgi:hypothetical protein